LAKKEGYKIKVYDPHVKRFEHQILDLEKAVKDSDCIVLIMGHDEFKKIVPEKISKLMKSKNLVDTQNILDQGKWKEAGFKVRVIGKINVGKIRKRNC
jgi:UDP-N-acetyl-D-mannosaminuronic acid dehydrogenase